MDPHTEVALPKGNELKQKMAPWIDYVLYLSDNEGPRGVFPQHRGCLR